MDYAENLLSNGQQHGVRVTEMRDTWRDERIIFEKLSSDSEKPLKIDPTTEATFCTSLSDYYALPARLTMGRILRAYLDKNNITMLELLFHPGHLRALDRMDTFYPSAIQHGAQLQAKLTGQTKMERLDKLQTVFDQVLKRARKSDLLIPYVSSLPKHGFATIIADIEANEDAKYVTRYIYGVLADYIQGGGWRDKFKRAIELAEAAGDGGDIHYADELIAEILDGVAAIDEIFGGFSCAGEAWKTYMLIIGSRFDKAPRYMSDDVLRLSVLFARHDMTSTREVLLRRISRGLAGTQSLSNHDRDRDRSDFIGLVRDLIEPTGITGGPPMVEAMILRAKSLLGDEGADLPIDTAIRQALYLMPSQAARLGVLLDLTASELGQKHDVAIRQQLLHLLNELRSIYDLFPQDVTDQERIRGTDALRVRLGMSALGDEFKTTLSTSLNKLFDGNEAEIKIVLPSASQKVSNTQDTQQAPKPRPTSKDGELELAKGEVLFEEGEMGAEAYLILDGIIEVSRTHNGKTQHLAMLSKGEILGEMSLIDHQPRMASATAAVTTRLACISDENLHERMDALAKNDQVLHFLLKTLVRRLRGLARITE